MSKEMLLTYVKQYGLMAGLLVLGIVSLGLGAWQFFAPSETEMTFKSGEESLSSISPTAVAEIAVDIEGAVNNPGVYHLPKETRLSELIRKAGSFHTKADKEKIAHSVNLAEKLTDGAKVYLPFVGETQAAGVNSSTVLGVISNTSGVININTASAEQLDSLPGVGSVTAQKIISARPYSTPQGLIEKKVMGQAAFQKIKDKITTD